MSRILGTSTTDAAAGKTPEALQGIVGGMNAMMQAWGPVGEYVTDSMQRTILFWDVLRQRSEQYFKNL